MGSKENEEKRKKPVDTLKDVVNKASNYFKNVDKPPTQTVRTTLRSLYLSIRGGSSKNQQQSTRQRKTKSFGTFKGYFFPFASNFESENQKQSMHRKIMG